MRAGLRKRQQSPAPGALPLLLESGTVLLEEFTLGRIVQQHKLAILVQTSNDHVVEWHRRPRLQSNNQWAAFLQVLLQVRPISSKGVGGISVVLEIPHHVR